MSTELCLNVYYSLFYSFIIYGTLVWQFTSKDNLKKITLDQKKLVRILTFSKNDAHTNPLFKNLNLLKINDIFISEIIKFFFSFINSCLPGTILNLFDLNLSKKDKVTRSSHHIYIPYVKTERYGRKSLRYNGAVIWNTFFDQNIRNTNTVKSFSTLKTFLKKHFVSS